MRRIAEGQFYEAHQQLRVITARYLKANDYASAADILYNGSLLLLQADQIGSGGDLAVMLVNEVYMKGEFEVTNNNKKRLIEILQAFSRGEPIRKRYVQDFMNWSSKFGDMERGDPDLHHAVGAVYAEGAFNFQAEWLTYTNIAAEGEAYDAERHLILGTSASAPILSHLHFDWYKADSPHTAALYASRSTLSYLILGNLQSATTALNTFTSALTQSASLPTQQIESSKTSVRIFQSLPLLNFLSLLLLACQKADANLFRQLSRHYEPHLKEVEEYWADALTQIGDVWFSIKTPRQGGNPLFDMMGSMLFGGNQGGSGGAPKPAAKPKLPSAPVAMDLD